MRVRKKVGGLRQFGGSQLAFWINDAEGVGQNIETRLGLWLSQWYLNVDDGTPWETKVLGKGTEPTRDIVVRARILATPGVLEISSYSSSLDRFSRKWTVSGTVLTAYSAGAVAFKAAI